MQDANIQRAQYIVDSIVWDKHIVNFLFTHSSGHGWQNVNKRETKAELSVNVFAIPDTLLTIEQKEKLIAVAGNFYHAGKWEIFLYNQETRYQWRNKENVLNHLKQLIELVLKEEKQRIPTVLPVPVKKERSETKKIHSEKKARRKIDLLLDM